MKNLLLLLLLFTSAVTAYSQRQKHISLAVTNHNSAMPFSKFGGLFQPPLHPGFEVAYDFNWKTRKKHDWFQSVKVGYFYHRFVQHGIPLYTTFGYRYKFSKAWSAESSLAAGYMHSIPATAKFKLNEAGEYENNKGIGRMQAIAAFNVGASHTITNSSTKSVTVFTLYQQRLQFPFINNYVPLLPYNTLMIGVRSPLK
ncbi:MAG TPA: hypothetical protein VF622_12940 [Segetibacter sp.]|jgi:hypothetical protein